MKPEIGEIWVKNNGCFEHFVEIKEVKGSGVLIRAVALHGIVWLPVPNRSMWWHNLEVFDGREDGYSKHLPA